MAASLDLVACKKNLADAIGDDMKVYLQLLKSWFRTKLTKEDFDHEARKMLPTEAVQLHNHFILALIHKCQSLGSTLMREQQSSSETITSPGKKKDKKSSSKRRKAAHTSATHSTVARTHFQQRFVPVNILQQALPVNLPAEPDERGPAFASRELLLPDIGMVHGRMIVTAWDFGMENVEDNAVRMLMQATQMALKNILTIVLARRNAYRLRDKKFRYAMGTELPVTSYRNAAHVMDISEVSEATSVSHKGAHMPTVKPSFETGSRDAAMQLACAAVPPPGKLPVTLFDLFDALQVHKSAIPSHTVYATNMERIINKLWHPSNEELLQEDIHKQEVAIKREISAHQIGIRS